MPIPGFTNNEEEEEDKGRAEQIGGQFPSDYGPDTRTTPELGPDEIRQAIMDRSNKKLHKVINKQSAVARVVNASAKIADILTDEDRHANLEVIRNAKKARTRIYNSETRRHEMVPDSKIQLAAVTLQLAYDEGLPVQRSIAVTGSFKDAGELLATLNESPAAREALKMLSNMGVQVVNDGEIIELEEVTENQEDATDDEKLSDS